MNLRHEIISMLKAVNIWIRQSNLCHSIPDRCFTYNNRCLPICARCMGILIGGVASLLIFNIFNIYLSYHISIILVIPMILDGGLQYVDYTPSTNNRRFVTGFLFGVGTIVVIRNIVHFILYQFI
ncbi:DUF2085 domain-containing protein [Methanosarcinales archaeon]|nr:MAG: DUF2085 domain-containing protein [Methanosarcinales archaeon]